MQPYIVPVSLFPAEVNWLLLPVLFAAGGFANRMRGGYPNLHSTSLGRLAFALAFGVVAFLRYPEGYGFIASTVVAVYVGSIMGWSTYMDLGRNPNGYLDRGNIIDDIVGKEIKGATFFARWCRDFLGLTIRGFGLSLLIGIVPWIWGIDSTFIFAGLSMGLCYEMGFRLPSRRKNFQTGPELGEFIFGGYLFVAFYLLVG